MSETQYDELLLTILTNEKSILGFLSTIFNFLGRRTDFYYVPETPDENLGFPPGEVEKLVIKILRKCDPKNLFADNNNTSQDEIDNQIMCSTVSHEVEICDEEAAIEEIPNEAAGVVPEEQKNIEKTTNSSPTKGNHSNLSVECSMPVLPASMKSECYNGAERDKYTWSQTIADLDVIIKLPPNNKTAKDLKVSINMKDICVETKSGEIIIKDKFPHKIKASESIWSISEGRLMIHLEKDEDSWWKSLLMLEEQIDLSKIDCSRSIYDLPESHVAKIRELQWNQEQKIKGLPTSDELRNMEILKKAWNVEGSPFKGTAFDPSNIKF